MPLAMKREGCWNGDRGRSRESHRHARSLGYRRTAVARYGNELLRRFGSALARRQGAVRNQLGGQCCRPETPGTAEIARIEGEINARVYALFDLTPEEIALLEASL